MTENGEMYRLADPSVCLVCGADSTFFHLCCSPEKWGERFSYQVTSTERSERVAGLAAWCGVTYQRAEQIVADLHHRFGDYTEVATAFFRALHAFLSFRPEVHDPDCADCALLASGSALCGPLDLPRWETDGRCPLARLHLAKVHLTLYEDMRHGLDYGATITEYERRAREQRVAERMRGLEGATVGQIVDRALNGG